MNFDNITKQNFNEELEELFNIINWRRDILDKHQISNDKNKIKTQLVDENGNDFNEEYDKIISIGFIKLFKFSHKNNIYFMFCSSIVYENTFENRFKEYENELIDVKKIDFIKKEYTDVVNGYFDFINQTRWNTEAQDFIEIALKKKRDFLISLLLENNHKVVESYNPQSILPFDTVFINLNNPVKEQNPKHENIFSNNGFILFDHILNEYVETKIGRKSDISFYYRAMYNNDPQYIHQRPEPFKKWFFDNYNFEDLGKIKTYNNVDNPDRRKHYSNALDWFKQHTK